MSQSRNWGWRRRTRPKALCRGDRTLRWGHGPGPSGWALRVNTGVRGGVGLVEAEVGEETDDGRCCAAGFEGGGKGRTSAAGDRTAGTDEDASGRNQPSRHTNCSPRTLIYGLRLSLELVWQQQQETNTSAVGQPRRPREGTDTLCLHLSETPLPSRLLGSRWAHPSSHASQVCASPRRGHGDGDGALGPLGSGRRGLRLLKTDH